ncbi:BCCT family transporter [Novilysobacter defluvii]|uniref:BCCT family transporter n=1 Tax=Novilysobacter defluvii TaxID=391738 RepID=UPI000408183A|nr:BCCT family transporter [Lysobacter defluvii]
MPIDPPPGEPSEQDPGRGQAGGKAGKPPPPPLERRRFGGSERPHARAEEDDTPVSRSDLSKGPEELLEHRASRTNWRVLVIASVVILAFSVWVSLVPDEARTTMKATVDWIATNLGWYYVVTITLVIGFVLWVALSKEGNVRVGPDHSRSQYGLGTWVAMLFAAGVGIDMLFYSVTGPVAQYLYPPTGDGGSPRAVQDAVVWTMFHYGIAGWSMYALLGMAMGYFAYRWGMPLSIRAALYPLLGKRVRGPLGDGISTIALVGTVFGVATSMGIGVVLLSVGFSLLFGLQDGLAADRAGHRRRGPDHRCDHLGRGPGHPLDLRAQPVERAGEAAWPAKRTSTTAWRCSPRPARAATT